MKPMPGPNANLLHTYRPPSAGWRDYRNTTHTESGRNISRPPSSQTTSELWPAAAAVAIHWKFVPAVTKNRITSRRPSDLLKAATSGVVTSMHESRPRRSLVRSAPRTRSFQIGKVDALELRQSHDHPQGPAFPFGEIRCVQFSS